MNVCLVHEQQKNKTEKKKCYCTRENSIKNFKLSTEQKHIQSRSRRQKNIQQRFLFFEQVEKVKNWTKNANNWKMQVTNSNLRQENRTEPSQFEIPTRIFNSFFAKQCSLINSDSSLPSKIIKKTDNSLYSVKLFAENI